jgi:hypothetical protein
MKLPRIVSAEPPMSSAARTVTFCPTAQRLGDPRGIGLLLAPASGEETRSNIADKVRDIRDRVSPPEGGTGTYGE